jgi:hypothetical protein
LSCYFLHDAFCVYFESHVTMNSNKIIIVEQNAFIASMCHRLEYKSLGLHVLLSDLNKIWSFPARLSYKLPIQSFAEICSVIHVEHRTEGRDTANRRFSRLYEGTSGAAPKGSFCSTATSRPALCIYCVALVITLVNKI